MSVTTYVAKKAIEGGTAPAITGTVPTRVVLDALLKPDKSLKIIGTGFGDDGPRAPGSKAAVLLDGRDLTTGVEWSNTVAKRSNTVAESSNTVPKWSNTVIEVPLPEDAQAIASSGLRTRTGAEPATLEVRDADGLSATRQIEVTVVDH
ncbi:MAG TPA: hypothetical protein VGB14_05970 [Acidimicrobiales bacterium]